LGREIANATVTTTHWEHFSHGADIGVRGFGPTKADAFEQAALAMTAAITDPDLLQPQRSVQIACEAPDDELLLVDWLNALVYEMATRRMLFSQFDVRLSDGQLRATAWGEAIDPKWHQPAVEIKGATLTSVRVGAETDGSWVAQCVVDV
jgi:tRNA nucleotidyltransferase (CCA-adding enzyme)